MIRRSSLAFLLIVAVSVLMTRSVVHGQPPLPGPQEPVATPIPEPQEPIPTPSPPPDHFTHPVEQKPIPRTDEGVPVRELMRSIRIADVDVELPEDTFVEGVLIGYVCGAEIAVCPPPPAYLLRRGEAELILSHTGVVLNREFARIQHFNNLESTEGCQSDSPLRRRPSALS